MRKLLILPLLFCTLNVFAKTHHVNNGIISGLNNGTSWVNAFLSLHVAIDSARNGDTIKVAMGVYRPAGTSLGSFIPLKNGVIFLAGYSPATGDSTDAARNWVNFPVVLTAQLINGSPVDSLVVAKDVTALTVLDGFFVKGARRYGIRILNSVNLFFRNIIAEDNLVEAISISNSTADFRNSVFRNNQFGKTVYNHSGSNTGFYNCVFTGNTSASNAEPLLANTNAILSLINCTVVSNTGRAFVGNGSGNSTIKNCIFWNNLDAGRMEENDIVPNNHSVQVTHSITQTYYNTAVNSLLVAIHPRFVNISNPAGPDNRFFTSDDGLQLSIPCSPALNSGDNATVALLPTDILRQPRIFNAGIVDMGAYERQNAPGSFLRTVYVKNTNNTGTNDGSSWQNAFKTLQEALLYCADTIKIAAGIYLTSNSFVDSVFYIENKKILLGGYPATGNPADAERNPGINFTVFKGNYTGTSSGSFFPALKSYNNDSTTIIDGIAFTNDAASPGGSPNVQALRIDYHSNLKVINCNFTLSASQGITSSGVLISKSSSPSFFRCRFNPYMTPTGGFAVICNGNSVLKMSFCNFTGETISGTPRSGSAVSISGSSAIIDSCVFWKNPFSVNGDLIVCQNGILQISRCYFKGSLNAGILISNNNSTGTVTNTYFKPNSISVKNINSSQVFNHCFFDTSYNSYQIENTRSAPVFNNCVSISGRFMYNTMSSPTANNCTVINTFRGNTIGLDPSEEELVINDDSSTLHANNTIFWSNKPAPGKQEILNRNLTGNPTHNSISILTNCLTRVYGTDGVNGNKVGHLPRFYQLTDINGPDNIMLTTDDGIRLAKCSPAINAGNNSIGTILSTDILQQPRIFNTTVDIGAYESQETPDAMNSFYVNESATGNNSGINWQHAYKELQAAVCNACADTIRVAQGTYKPAVTDRDSTFYIDRPLSLLGGYPAAGNPADQQRNPDSYPAVVNGSIGHLLDSMDNSKNLFVIVGTKDSVVIDGFTIRNGFNAYGGVSLNGAGGAGIFTYYNHTVITNCRFINNRARPDGGAVYIAPRTTARINKSVFNNNSSTNEGGALVLHSGGSLNLSDCVFENNYTAGQGGAMRLLGDYSITNTVFSRNYTTLTNSGGRGGAVSAVNSGLGTFANCTFFENKTASTLAVGGGLSTNESFGINVYNCIFKGNSIGGTTTSLLSDMDWANYNIVFKTMMQTPRSFTLPTNIIYSPPAFKDSLNPIGPDGKWMTADDGLQLNYNSPAINFGDNAAVTNLPFDILQNTRIINGVIDLGPYEYQNLPVANAGPDTSICAGQSAQIGKPGNPAHSYSWISSPGGFTSTLMTPTVSPAVTTIYVLEVSNGAVTARDTVIVTPSATLTPSVSVSASSATICQGNSVTFTATPLHGGTAPAFQWQVNGVNAGTNQPSFTTSSLNNNDQVKVILTSNASCVNPSTATSNTVSITVNPIVVPAVSIVSVPSPTFCPGETVTYTATAVNGGSLPYFTWLSGTGLPLVVQRGISNTFSTNSVATLQRVWVEITSNAGCANPVTALSNQIDLTAASQVTPTVSISVSANNICSGTAVNFIANPVNGGATPAYQWKVNGINQGTNNAVFSSSTLANGDIVSVVMTSSLVCVTAATATSNTISMIVTPPVIPSVTISGNFVVNAGNSTLITTTIMNGGSAPVYQWQDSTAAHSWQTISGATGSQLSYTPAATGDRLRCLMTSNAVCATPATATSNTAAFTVNLATGINPVPANNFGIKIYPNPVSSVLFVDSLKLSDRWQYLDIISADGRIKILTKNITNQLQVTCDVNRLSSGFYIVLLKSRSGKTVYYKIIKL